MRHEPGFLRCISEKPLTSTRAHTARAGDRYVMTKGRKGDSYIGGIRLCAIHRGLGSSPVAFARRANTKSGRSVPSNGSGG
jgi:hypothetical protein